MVIWRLSSFAPGKVLQIFPSCHSGIISDTSWHLSKAADVPYRSRVLIWYICKKNILKYQCSKPVHVKHQSLIYLPNIFDRDNTSFVVLHVAPTQNMSYDNFPALQVGGGGSPVHLRPCMISCTKISWVEMNSKKLPFGRSINLN
jgi:hypothetical protein